MSERSPEAPRKLSVTDDAGAGSYKPAAADQAGTVSSESSGGDAAATIVTVRPEAFEQLLERARQGEDK